MLFVSTFRALMTLLYELLFGVRLLSRQRLMVNTKGVDPHQLLSSKGGQLKAFCDGSVLQSGQCGIAVFYTDGHMLNYHGGVVPGGAADSNLVELVALFCAVLRHPRGQHLTVFSDSAHALRLVDKLSESPERSSSGNRARRRQRPPSEPREACVVRVLHWLLRLRTAQSCFYKVPGHKHYKQNEIADALAQRAAAESPSFEPPLSAGWWQLVWILVRYLLQQDPLDGGMVTPPRQARAPRRATSRPQPTGESKELTRVCSASLAMACCICALLPCANWSGVGVP